MQAIEQKKQPDSTKKGKNPPAFLAIAALIIAFSLPFCMVKLFSKQKTISNNQSATSINARPSFFPTITPTYQTALIKAFKDKQKSLNLPNLAQEKNAKERIFSLQEKPKLLDTTNKKNLLPRPTDLNTLALELIKKEPQSKQSSALTTSLQNKKEEKASFTASGASKQATTKPQEQALKTKALPNAMSKKILIVGRGDSLSSIFKKAGLSPKTLQIIVQNNRYKRELNQLKNAQRLKFYIKNNTLEKLILPISLQNYLKVSRQGLAYKTELRSYKTTAKNRYAEAIIRGSLYKAAQEQNIPYNLVHKMTELFSGEMNFAKNIRPGDRLSMVYSTRYIKNKFVGSGDILAVTYQQANGKKLEAIRYTDRSGHSDYYTSQGGSLKKAFNRFPLRFSHISSPFNLSRMHPLLHYRRPHRGVDLSAPIGTPIRATGDGRIEFIGRQNGYGNMIKLSHSRMYSSIYGHMLRFQKGLSRGSYVKRDQIIGYVGQSGLASGPHCHYEFHVNHQPRNPTTIDLPKGLPMTASALAAFRRQTAPLLAQLSAGNKKVLLAKK